MQLRTFFAFLSVFTGLLSALFYGALPAKAAPSAVDVPTPSHSSVFVIGEASYTLDGETRVMDAKTFTTNGRTYVPIRYLAYCCGISDQGVQWDGDKGEVTLTLEHLEVKLRVGSMVLTKNGIPQTMDTSVLGRDGRTYLPARFVAEAFGYQVDWQPYDQAVLIYPPGQEPPVPAGNDLTIRTEVSNTKTEVIIEASAVMDYTSFILRNPYRVVVDITGIPAGALPGNVVSDSPLLSAIRTGRQDGGTKVRVVADLVESPATTRYKVRLAADKYSLVIEFWKADDALDDRTVVLDAGHGGKDPGAISASGLQEKTANLAMALEAARLLEEQGIEVLLTRDRDEFIELKRRTEIANEAGADLFVSIHCNANNSSSYQGTSTYYSTDNIYGGTIERKQLAQTLQAEMLRMLGRRDVGVRTAGFVVTKYTRMPSCLVEVAFLSNPQEDALLWTDDFRDGAAHAIANGIVAYLSRW